MSLSTSVEPLEDNKVRLHVAIPAEDFERAIDAAFRKLAKDVKMPGFRPGKAPRRLLEARLGTEMARDQALRDSLPEYYVEAVVAERRRRHRAAGDRHHSPARKTATSSSTPWSRCARSSPSRATTSCASRSTKPDVSDDDVDEQIDQLRDRFADLDRLRRAAHRRRLTPRSTSRDSIDERIGRGPHRHRLPLRGRFGDRRAEARRSSCTASGPATSSSSTTRCPSASASAPTTRSPSRSWSRKRRRRCSPSSPTSG